MILLVANAPDLASFLPVLESAKFGVMGAAGLPAARALLKQFRPDVLVTSLRLGEYNGFQLVMAAREEHGPLPTFVVGEADPHTEAQAERAGAQLITDPPAAPDFAALIMRAFRSEAPRRWHRIRPDRPVVAEVRTGGGQSVGTASLIDIGAGGMGLKLGPEAAEGLPRTPLEVSLPAQGVTVPAEYVWHLERDGDVRCGVVVPSTARGSSGPWPKVVEQVRRADSPRRPGPSAPALTASSGSPTEALPASPHGTTE